MIFRAWKAGAKEVTATPCEEQKIKMRSFVVSILFAGITAQFAFTQAPGNRTHFVGTGPWAGVDFANFTYRKTCLGENVRVADGQASRIREGQKWTLFVMDVKYGDIGDGRNHAIVLTMCEWPAANPGAYPRDILVYDIAQGKPIFVAEFNPPQPKADGLPPNIWEADLVGIAVGQGVLSVERQAGAARCCPTLLVARSYRWSGSRWIEAGVKTRPYEPSVVPH